MKHFTTAQGLRLAAETWGDDSHQPVIFLHGGGQNRHSWGDTAYAVASRGFYSIAIDLRGHGESDYARDGEYHISSFADDIACVAAGMRIPPVLVGASLGGIISLIVAGELNIPVAGVVLVDVAFRAAVEGADRILGFMRKYINGFESLEEAAGAISQYLPHRNRTNEKNGKSGDLLKYLSKKRDGRFYWHWDPRFLDAIKLDEFMDTRRLVKAARSINAPLLLLRGMQSDVITGDMARELREAVPHARVLDIPGAAHTVPGDSNRLFTESIFAFLKERLPPS